jgi:hypothetical protein
MSTQDPGLTPRPDEQTPDEESVPEGEPGTTPPATAPEPGTLPEEPDVDEPEPKSPHHWALGQGPRRLVLIHAV